MNRRKMDEGTKYWIWRNGDHFLIFDNEYPTYDGGDPMTLGEPIGWGNFHHSFPRGGDIERRVLNVLWSNATPEQKIAQMKRIYNDPA